MSDYLQGLTRQQQLLFPDRLDDYVGADNAVRAIDSYVDMLDVDALGLRPDTATSITMDDLLFVPN